MVQPCPMCGGSGRVRNTDPSSTHAGTFIHTVNGVNAAVICSQCSGTGFVSSVKLKNNSHSMIPAEAVAFVLGGKVQVVPMETVKEIGGMFSHVGVPELLLAEIKPQEVEIQKTEIREIPVLPTAEQQKRQIKKDPLPMTGQAGRRIDWDDPELYTILKESTSVPKAREAIGDKYSRVPSLFLVGRAFKEAHSGRKRFPRGADGSRVWTDTVKDILRASTTVEEAVTQIREAYSDSPSIDTVRTAFLSEHPHIKKRRKAIKWTTRMLNILRKAESLEDATERLAKVCPVVPNRKALYNAYQNHNIERKWKK